MATRSPMGRGEDEVVSLGCGPYCHLHRRGAGGCAPFIIFIFIFIIVHTSNSAL